MKTSEFIFEKFSCAILICYIGAAYGLVASPIILFFFPKIKVIQVAIVFAIAFLVIGIISGNLIIDATIGIIYIIVGFFSGSTVLPTSAFRYIEHNGIKKDSIIFILIGIVSGVFVVLIYK